MAFALQAIGTLCTLGGILGFLITKDDLGTVYAATVLASGLVSALVFFALAGILDRLDAIMDRMDAERTSQRG